MLVSNLIEDREYARVRLRVRHRRPKLAADSGGGFFTCSLSKKIEIEIARNNEKKYVVLEETLHRHTPYHKQFVFVASNN